MHTGAWTILPTQEHLSLLKMFVCFYTAHIKEGCRFVWEEWGKRGQQTLNGVNGDCEGLGGETQSLFVRKGFLLSVCLNHSQGAAGYPQCSSVSTPRSNSYQIPPFLILSFSLFHHSAWFHQSFFPIIIARSYKHHCLSINVMEETN